MDKFELAREIAKGPEIASAFSISDTTQYDLSDPEKKFKQTASNAAKQGNVKLVKELIEEKKVKPINCVLGAVESGNIELLEYLANRSTSFIGYRSITQAAKNGKLDVLKWLHETKNSPIHGHEVKDLVSYASENGNTALLKYLFDEFAQPPKDFFFDAVQGALTSKSLDTIHWLENELKIDIAGDYPKEFKKPSPYTRTEQTLFQCACIKGAFDIARYIAEKTGLTEEDKDYALKHSHGIEWLRYIESQGKNVDFTGKQWGQWDSKFRACKTKEDYDYLISKHATPSETDLITALVNGKLEQAEWIKASGVKFTSSGIQTRDERDECGNIEQITELKAVHDGQPFLAKAYVEQFPEHRDLLPPKWERAFQAFDEKRMHKNEVLLQCGDKDRWYAMNLEGPRFQSELSPWKFNLKDYKRMLPVVVALTEAEGNPRDSEDVAYKLSVLFRTPEQALEYLKRYATAHPEKKNNSVHDACLFTLPTHGKWTPGTWATFLLGAQREEAFKLISRAPDIEQKLGRAPKSIAEAQEIGSKLFYERSDENPYFSKLCVQYGVSERGFERGLDVLKKKKKEDHIPDIMVDGSTLPAIYDEKNRKVNDKFYLKKIDDERVLLIGHIVGCCNHIEGATRDMAIAAVKSPDVGCYGLFKRGHAGQEDRIIAKVTPWISQSGNMVFNSWETEGSNWHYLCKPFLQAVAKQVMEKSENIQLVTVGFCPPSDTPSLGLPVLKEAEQPKKSGHSSHDSSKQYLLGVRSPEIMETIPISLLDSVTAKPKGRQYSRAG